MKPPIRCEINPLRKQNKYNGVFTSQTSIVFASRNNLFQALCQSGRLKKRAGDDERGLVEKKQRARALLFSPDTGCRLLAFPIVRTDREPGTDYQKMAVTYKITNLTRATCATCTICDGAVASWLVRSSTDRAGRVRALAGDYVLCSWARHSHSASLHQGGR